MAATTRTYYRDANQSIWSSAAGTLDQDATTLQQFRIANSAEMKLYADELRFINGGNYTGLAWDTNGQLDLKTKSGIMYSIRASIISTGISLPTTNRVQFRDSAIYIRSGLDSELDIVADGVVNFASAVNHSTNYIDIAGIAVPADPASSTRRLFVDTATGELSVRTSGGATVSLEASGDPDQNLWETFTADTGSATADSTTDSFDVNGGTGITTGISGDVLTIDWAAAIADLDDVSGTSGTGSTVVLTGSPTITTPTIASFANAAHDHADAAGGGQFSRNNLTGTLAIASGGTGQTAQTAAFDALAPTTTKGDVIVFNGSDNVRLPVGTDGYLIYADSTQASGVKWAKLSAAGVAEAYVTIGNSGTLTGERALTAGEGIDITDNGANSTVVISGENATDINKGIAAFDSGDFNVVDGLVSLAGGGGGAAVKSGRVTGISDGGSSAVTFNTAFPSGTVNVVATLENTNTADDCVRVSSISTTGFTINIRKGHGGAGHTWDVQWVATTAGDP